MATKIPPKNRRWPSRREFSLDDCYPPDYIFEYVEKSLANIGVETLDLMQFHTWEDAWFDDQRLPRAIEDSLRSSGKIRALGISLNRWEPWNGIRAVRAGLVDAVQVIYNIFDQESPMDELFPACREKDIAVIARGPVRRRFARRDPSRLVALGQRATGVTLISSRRISRAAWLTPMRSNLFSEMA